MVRFFRVKEVVILWLHLCWALSLSSPPSPLSLLLLPSLAPPLLSSPLLPSPSPRRVSGCATWLLPGRPAPVLRNPRAAGVGGAQTPTISRCSLLTWRRSWTGRRPPQWKWRSPSSRQRVPLLQVPSNFSFFFFPFPWPREPGQCQRAEEEVGDDRKQRLGKRELWRICRRELEGKQV